MTREGNLDIRPLGDGRFHVLFCRYDWEGGVMSPMNVTGRDALVRVLKEEIDLIPTAITEAMKAIDSGNTASLPNVYLSDETRLRLGLVSPAEGIQTIHRYLIQGMGAVQMLTLPYPVAVGQYWKWVCEQNPTLNVPGFGVTMGDTFRVDRWEEGDEPPADLSKQEPPRRYRTCYVTLVGNKYRDPTVPDATGVLDYQL